MRRVLSLTFLCLWILSLPVHAQEENSSDEEMSMIFDRMKSLSSGLDGIPQPPEMDKEIQLPEFRLKTAQETDPESTPS